MIFLPVLGTFLASFMDVLNYVYIDTWPVEVLYTETILNSVIGGTTCYYLGYYGLAADLTTPEERASRMAR